MPNTNLLNLVWSRFVGGTRDASGEIRSVCELLIERLGSSDYNSFAATTVSTASTVK